MPSLLNFLERRGLLPRLSETERQALAAGTVWLDGEIFSGRPNLRRILAEPYPELSAEEQAFLDGPVEEVCRLANPWEIARSRTIPETIWSFLRQHRFFGLSIPPAWGGLGFSPLAAGAVFGKLASRSLPLSAIVLIPNSVGPAELLLAHGTEEQRRRYLPRLASGEEIPCFALTEPEAGSDAAALASVGEVIKGPDGAPWLLLSWKKRYITLAPVATLLGLAVRLHDPENLLGRGVEPGITCVLVPTSAPGVEVGRRHDPAGVAIPNGPTEGRNVLVPASQILGGPEGAGYGWAMLMEALSAGRSISLPAQSVGGAKLAARVAGTYAQVRHQFGLPIGRFEGIEEPLARIAGETYRLEAARVFTAGAVGRGEKPAVISGALKVEATERLRRIVLDAMDVLGGAGLCRGPRNFLPDGLASASIGITVEGANILTRTLIVFGQGLFRSHPYIRRALAAIETRNENGLRKALLGHFFHFLRLKLRTLRLDLSRGRFTCSPMPGPTAKLWRRLAWASARFALLAEAALFAQGARLKRAERLSGRFADAFGAIYLGLCALRRHAAESAREEDLPFVRWAVEKSLADVQTALDGILANFTGRLTAITRGPWRWVWRISPLGHPPDDALGAELAKKLQAAGEQRDRLTAGIYLPTEENEALGRLEKAFRLTLADDPAAAEARREAIEVDSFTLAEYLGAVAEEAATARAI